MKITVFHNVSTDNVGRLLGMLDGYQPGHALVPVAEYEDRSSKVEPMEAAHDAANEAYRLFNVGDDPTFGTPSVLAVDYRKRGNRSLSVGDVIHVLIRDHYSVWLACASVGWDHIEEPAFFALECSRHGTASVEPAHRR